MKNAFIMWQPAKIGQHNKAHYRRPEIVKVIERKKTKEIEVTY